MAKKTATKPTTKDLALVPTDTALAEVAVKRDAMTPQERIKENEELVRLLAPEIQENHLISMPGQGKKKFMCLGGGIAIANSMGYEISVGEVTFNKGLGAWQATATMDNGVSEPKSAVGYVGDDEERWMKGPKAARYSMTQSRAQAKLCRANFGHLYVLMGASTATPAEEMQMVTPDRKPRMTGDRKTLRPSEQRGPLPNHSHPQPAAPAKESGDDLHTDTFTITDVSHKIGRNGEPVKSGNGNHCWAITTSDGLVLETFFGKFVELAQEAMGFGQEVTATYKHDEKWDQNSLEEITLAAQVPQETPDVADTPVAEEEIPF